MIKRYDAFVFDLDGTLYKEEKIIKGADNTVNTLKRMGKKVIFISNKTTGSAYDYFQLMRRLNIMAEEDEVINSTIVTRNYLCQNFPGAVFYAIGETPFIEELQKAGLKYSDDPSEIQVVLVTLDRTLNFSKIETAAQAIENGARFFAANIDNTCPVISGEITDAGITIAALEKRTFRKLEMHFGKPSRLMFAEILKKLKTDTSRILLIGDRLETDIAMGNYFGVDTALVATGVKNIFPAGDGITPTWCFNSVADILTFEAK
jgi:arabinose operon protein AraL